MLEPTARRLVVASAVRLHVARALGVDPLPDALDPAGLRALAARLGDDAQRLARVHRLTFDPAYPGATRGVEEVRGGRRLVLTCVAAHDGVPAAMVITTLVPGRAPQVAAAPHTPHPGGG